MQNAVVGGHAKNLTRNMATDERMCFAWFEIVDRASSYTPVVYVASSRRPSGGSGDCVPIVVDDA